jgi:TonB family protein
MKRLFFLIGLFVILSNFVIFESLNAQSTDTLIYLVVEDMPTFSTCDNTEDTDRKCTEAAVEAFVKANMEYPEFALKMGVEGAAVVSCIVEKDGSLSDFKIIRNPGAETGEEALRIIKHLPNFQPGKQRGEVLRVQMNFPVRFRITPEVKAKAKARKKAEKARRKTERKKKG